MNTFGQTLRDLRRRSGVNQRELASKVGVDFSFGLWTKKKSISRRLNAKQIVV